MLEESHIAILIPAYNPEKQLISLVKNLLHLNFLTIVVVNDGSSQAHAPIFAQLKQFPNITLLEHAINLGKGGALKTGLNYIYTRYPNYTGVITVDADGQHAPEDILNISKAATQNHKKLIIGSRRFKKNVPFRSKIGNLLTRKFFKLMSGLDLSDTQSGLRFIPLDFIPRILDIRANHYEFELEMLLLCRYANKQILEIPIKTIYIDNNQSSHFNPLLDSLKIYFELFRSTLLSLATAILDNIVFFISIHDFGSSILAGQIIARFFAVIFNYPLAKKTVFISQELNRVVLPKYLTLVIISGAVSYGVMQYLIQYMFSNIFFAKILAEIVIYLGNFAIQRDFIFTHKLVDAKIKKFST
ncbi:MAG: bifunctional glycosyltransferase family 2/GtrA family protein [Gammaproteobacteria bacterium]|nr:bifunctional glycosyltransferase family 2/GtrA family protein [Gammaproteobacteria bacterium]